MLSLFGHPIDEPPSGWLDQHASLWVERGLVSTDQIDAIRDFEHHDSEHRAVEPEGLSIGAEVAVYLGSVLALASGAMMVGRSWDTLGLAGRVAIGVAVAVLGFFAAARLLRLDSASTHRLASFMWVIATGGVALAIGAAMDEVNLDEPGWTMLAIGVPVMAISLYLWRNLDRPLQVLTTAVGVGLTIGGIGVLLGPPAWIGAIIVWTGAVVVGALALTQRLRPELDVLAVAAIGAIIGAAMLSDVSEVGAMTAATITGAGIVAVGLARRLVPILVIGVIAFLQSLMGLLTTTLNGPVAAMIVAVVGLTVVVVVITRSTRGKSPQTS